MTEENKSMSMRQAHPTLFDPGFLFLIVAIIAVGLMLLYVVGIEYPQSIDIKNQIKNMSCDNLKLHLTQNDISAFKEEIKSQIIGRYLK